MATLLEQIKNLEKLSEKAITSELFKALKDAEKLIIDLNKSQLKNNEDRSGILFSNYAYSTENHWRHVDRPKTQELFDYKVVENKYNFEWSGDFFEGLNLSISGDEAIIDSTGMSGEKEGFIRASEAMGLKVDNLKVVIKTRLLPHLHKFARTTLNI